MAAVQPLLDWAAALPGGAVSAKICAGTGDGAARTLVAAEDLPAGEVMVQVMEPAPISAIYTPHPPTPLFRPPAIRLAHGPKLA